MVSRESKKDIALERVRILFKEAEEVFKEDKKLANKYVNQARKIAMKVNLKLPREIKRKFCKHCYSYLKHGINVTVRSKDGKVIYTCKECGKIMRFSVLKERKKSS